jgi:hypothetical protein
LKLSEQGVEAMTEKKDRDRVMAEITLSHVLRLATEQGSPLSREQALAFLNQEGRAFEMWKQMMQAGEEFIARSFLRQCISPERAQPRCVSVIITLRT